MRSSFPRWQVLGALFLVASCGPEPAQPEQGIKQALSLKSLLAGVDDGNQGEDKGDGSAPPPVVRVKDDAQLALMRGFVRERLDLATIKTSLRTLQGRGVHCVERAAQPALKKAGEELQLAPRSLAPADQKRLLDDVALFAKTSDNPVEAEPLVDASGQTVGSCPEGTVPMAEVTEADLVRFETLDDYFKKVPSHLLDNPIAKRALLPPAHEGPNSLHQYAHAYRYVTNWGAQTNINLWRPYTELNSEFSLGQIWVVGGSGSGLQTLEVGVQKYRDLYGDTNTHLFIYSTRDGYNHTGCYNNSCGDFVQVSSSIYPGATLGPISTDGGSQYSVNVHWFKDMDNGSWWLSFQGKWVGYYPRNLYSTAGVANRAAEIDFGGEIIDHQNLNLHTSTDMGSGKFPSAGWTHAAYMRNIRYNYTFTTNPNIVWYTDVTGLTSSRSDSACYDISVNYGSPNWGTYFYYGGPGFSSVNCR